MIRNLIRNFQKVVILSKVSSINTSTALATLARRGYTTETEFPANNLKTKQTTTLLATSNASDSDYIVPLEFDKDKQPAAHAIVATLRTRYRLNDEDVLKIMNDDIVNRSFRGKALIRSLELLALEGVSKNSFIDYPWLITLDKVRLEQKLHLIKLMPIRNINHFVGFLRLSVSRLKKLVSALNREADTIPYGNRLYYISEQLKLPPYTVTKFLSKRLFVLEMPFEMLEQNLQNMIQYNVSPLNILKDLWAFRYTPKSVKLRLERARRAKKCKIMPWMVRCPENILQRSLKLSLDELAVLGNKTSVAEYLAERLNFSVSEAEAIMDRHPQVHTVRVTKIKEVLDYLLDEAGFDPYDIAQTPRVLCHSLDTTKQRLDELKQMGCRPNSLIIVCRSKREYEKFVQMWKQKGAKFGKDSTTMNSHKETENNNKEF